MRLRAITVLVAAATIAWLVWMGPASSSPEQGVRYELVEVADLKGPFTEVIDIGGDGLGPGDSILEHHPVVDPDTGEVRGEAITHIRVVRDLGDDRVMIVDCTIALTEGDLVFYGGSRLSEVSGDGALFPVTGGTGRYSEARGEVRARRGTLDGKPVSFLSFELSLW